MIIPTDFVIPKDYLRVFYFEEPATGFKHWIVAEDGKLTVGGTGDASPVATSKCLDWCQESIEQIRFDVDADEQLSNNNPLPGDDLK